MKKKLFILNKIIVRGAWKVFYITQNKSNDCISFERWFQSYSTRAAYSPICGWQSDSNRCSTIQNNTLKRTLCRTNPVLPNTRVAAACVTCNMRTLSAKGMLHTHIQIYHVSFVDPYFHAAFTLIWMLSNYASPHRFITHYTVKSFSCFFHHRIRHTVP